MITALVGQDMEVLDTPALLVDLDALNANIGLMESALRQHGVGWRPHSKAHKSPAVAH